MKTKIQSILLILSIFIGTAFLNIGGCVSVFPANSNANSTPALSASTSSNVVIGAEKTLRVSKDSIDLFLHLEFDNQVFVKANLPEVHKFAETLRQKAPGALIAADKAKNVFKHNRNAENQANLMTAVATVSELAAQAQAFTNKLNHP